MVRLQLGRRLRRCNWPEDGNEIEKARYARSLDITLAEAEQLNVKSKVFVGAVVLVRGERWGVLLLDSREPGCISNAGTKKSEFNTYAVLVSAVLEESSP